MKKNLFGKTPIKQDRFTQNQKKKKGFVISSQETYLLRLISCVEHVVACQKQIADLKGPSLLRKLEKIRKWKKKKISVTVTYLLNAKASRSKLSSMAELT